MPLFYHIGPPFSGRIKQLIMHNQHQTLYIYRENKIMEWTNPRGYPIPDSPDKKRYMSWGELVELYEKENFIKEYFNDKSLVRVCFSNMCFWESIIEERSSTTGTFRNSIRPLKANLSFVIDRLLSGEININIVMAAFLPSGKNCELHDWFLRHWKNAKVYYYKGICMHPSCHVVENIKTTPRDPRCSLALPGGSHYYTHCQIHEPEILQSACIFLPQCQVWHTWKPHVVKNLCETYKDKDKMLLGGLGYVRFISSVCHLVENAMDLFSIFPKNEPLSPCLREYWKPLDFRFKYLEGESYKEDCAHCNSSQFFIEKLSESGDLTLPFWVDFAMLRSLIDFKKAFKRLK